MKNGSKNIEAIEKKFELYRSLYELPIIEHEEHVDSVFWKHIKKHALFLIIAVFDENGRLLVLRDFSKQYGWELIGGSANIASINNLQHSVQILAKRILGISIYDLQPIAFAKNVFKNEEKAITHHGIAFTARLNGPVHPKTGTEWGFFKQIPENMFASNKDIANLALKTFKTKNHRSALGEVISSQQASWRYFIHNTITHNVLGKFASAKLEKQILRTLKDLGIKNYTLLDTSCGDDGLVFKIAKSNPTSLIICNDISPRHLDFLNSRAKAINKDYDFIFTNHNLLDIPFKKKFDVILCKNTLHHLQSSSEMLHVLDKLKKLGKTIILMDIEDPVNNSWISWIWNKYYVYFLDDQGANFLTESELSSLLASIFNKGQYKISKIQTIKGAYLLAIISSIN